MDCNETQIRLSAYVDGELAAEDFFRVAAHAQACRECRRARAVQAFVHIEVRRAAARFTSPALLRERVLLKLGF